MESGFVPVAGDYAASRDESTSAIDHPGKAWRDCFFFKSREATVIGVSFGLDQDARFTMASMPTVNR